MIWNFEKDPTHVGTKLVLNFLRIVWRMKQKLKEKNM